MQGYPRVLPLHVIHILIDDHVRSASSIYQQLELAVAHISAISAQLTLLFQDSIT
jgi:hypothetical protein